MCTQDELEYPQYLDSYEGAADDDALMMLAEKRAWNSGLSGMGKRAWNSGFSSGMGRKRAWNSGFAGMGRKRAWNSGFAGQLIRL